MRQKGGNNAVALDLITGDRILPAVGAVRYATIRRPIQLATKISTVVHSRTSRTLQATERH